MHLFNYKNDNDGGGALWEVTALVILKFEFNLNIVIIKIKLNQFFNLFK